MHSRSRMVAAAGAAALVSFAAAQSAHANTMLSGTATADNVFYAYVSTNPAILGTLVGSGGNWSAPFPVASSTLGPGTYFLQIEAINQGGPGGFSGIFNLNGDGKFSNGTQSMTSDPANLAYWWGGYNNDSSSGSPQPWVQPTGGVAQATYGWGNVVGTSNWIWPSDAMSGGANACGLCTVDMMTEFSVPRIGGVPEPATWAMMLLGFGAIGFAIRRRVRPADGKSVGAAFA